MSQYMTLVGAEEVSRAASRMASAADSMQSAASSIDDVFRRQRDFLEDWLSRFAEVLQSGGQP